MNSEAQPITEARPTRLLARTVRLSSILTGLFLLFGFQQLLLWRFLGFAPWWLYALAGPALLAAAVVMMRFTKSASGPAVSLGVIACCAGIAFLLCLLGGEGGFFYQNWDWQFRNAQLYDIIRHPWPFTYTVRGVEEVHRAQVGMFLIPGLAGKAFGQSAADIAVLLQNAGILTLVLSSASVLFKSARSRLLAALVIVIFSGMDILGQELLVWNFPTWPRRDHLEHWMPAASYQSHISQIFWAPHHSIVGWLGATLYLLWRVGQIRPGAVLAFAPVFLLWSPLAVMGLLPFLAHVGLDSLARRKLGWPDLVPPALATIITLPSLLYLGAASVALGYQAFFLSPKGYLLFEAVEVLPYIAAAFLVAARSRFGGVTLFVVAGTLLLIPMFQIGENFDFQMRASIPALFILSIITVDVLLRCFAGGASGLSRILGAGVILALAIGSVTGWREVRRALVYRPAPPVECGVYNAWGQLDHVFQDGQFRLYVAPVSAFPNWMRPTATTLVPARPERCWTRAWMIARG